MHDIGCPTQFLHCLKHTTGIEHTTLEIVGIFVAVVVAFFQTLGKEVVIVDEIDLHACSHNRRYLDDKLIVGIVDNQVHA